MHTFHFPVRPAFQSKAPVNHSFDDYDESTKSTEKTVSTPLKKARVSPVRPHTTKNQPLNSKRSKLQLQLIEEVNSKGSSPTHQESTAACSVASEKLSSRSRVQKIPKTQELPAMFRVQKSCQIPQPNRHAGQTPRGTEAANLPPSTPLKSIEVKQNEGQVPKMRSYFASGPAKVQSAQKASNSNLQIEIESPQQSSKPSSFGREEPPPPAKSSSSSPKSSPKSSPTSRPHERQIKYLGLVIEKDDEYALQLDEVKEGEDLNQVMKAHPVDNVRRQYLPIREHYIRIVKNSRKVVIESYEKRGRKDFRKTLKNLVKFGKELAQSHQ